MSFTDDHLDRVDDFIDQGHWANARAARGLARQNESAKRFRWEICFEPDDPGLESEVLEFTGTRDEAERFADKNHPDYLCQMIEFNRCGESRREPEPEPPKTGDWTNLTAWKNIHPEGLWGKE